MNDKTEVVIATGSSKMKGLGFIHKLVTLYKSKFISQ